MKIELFSQFKEKVQDNVDLEIKALKSRGHINVRDIEKLEFYIGTKLNEDFKDFYLNGQILSAYWKANCFDDDKMISATGVVYISAPMSMVLFNKKPEKYGLAFLENILNEQNLIFDSLQYGHYVLLCLNDSEYSFKLVLPNGNVFVLDLELKDYLKYTIKYRGIFCWQAYYSNHYEKWLTNCTYEGILEDLEFLFPNEDFSELEDRIMRVPNDFHFVRSKETNYQSEFKRHFTDLDKKQIALKSKINIAASFGLIRNIELFLGQRLPYEMTHFFIQHNGVNVYWEKIDDSSVYGSFKILSLDEIFGGENRLNSIKWDNNVVKYLGLSEHDFPQYLDCFPLVVEESRVIAFRLNGNEPEFFLFEDFEMVRIKMPFKELILKLYECRGIEYWQLLVIDVLRDKNKVLAEKVKAKMQSLFPDSIA